MGNSLGEIGSVLGDVLGIGSLFGLGQSKQPIPYNLTQEASGYRKNAASQFSNLAGIGQQDITQGQGLFNYSLPLYDLYAGLPGGNLSPAQQLNVAGQTGMPPQTNVVGNPSTTPSTAGATATTIGGLRQPPSTAGATPQQPLQQGALQQQAMYALSPAQQTQLNSNVDQINQSMAQALSQYQAQTAGNPNPAGEALIRQYYGAQAQTTQANFIAQALQAKLAATQYLMGEGLQLQGMGEGDIGQAGQGYSNLGGQTQQAYQFAQGQSNAQSAGQMQLAAYLLSQLGNLPGAGGSSGGINNAGQLVGNAYTTDITGANLYSGGNYPGAPIA